MAVKIFGRDHLAEDWGIRKECGSQRPLSQNNSIIKPKGDPLFVQNDLVIRNSSTSNSIAIVVHKIGSMFSLQDDPDQHCIFR